MDPDNSNLQNCSMDVEQSLLEQFNCMGTRDRDDLIKEFQRMFGTQINYTTAAFFLDMNSWNLQAAICSYLDVQNSGKLPSMILKNYVADVEGTYKSNLSEIDSIEPNSNFEKTWNICNNGVDSWPAGCYVRCAGGDPLGAVLCQPSFHDGRPLEASQSCVVRVQMRSPAVPGTYQSKWRLCTPDGAYFGEPLWVIVTVIDNETAALVERFSHFDGLGRGDNVAEKTDSEECRSTPPPAFEDTYRWANKLLGDGTTSNQPDSTMS